MKDRLERLRRDRSKALSRVDAIFEVSEERDLTDEERSQIDELQDTAEKLHEDIRRLETRIKQQEEAVEMDEPEFTDVKGGEDRGAKKPFRSLGEQLMAVRASTLNPMNIDKRLYEQRVSGASEGVPSDGGFLVQKDFADELFMKAMETGLLSSRVRRVPVQGNGLKANFVDETSRADGSRYGGVRAYWKNEGESPTTSKPKFGQIDLSLEKLIATYFATDELLADAMALESLATQFFSDEMGFKIDDAIINGTGAGQPLGVLNSNALVSVSKESGQSADTILWENIQNIWARLWSRSRSNSVWLINQDILPQLMGMEQAVGTGGVPVYLPANQAAGQPFQTLLGRPILEIEQAQTLGDKGDIILADLSQYLMIEKGGLQSASSIHVKFEEDETAFRFVLRANGQPLWSDALTPFKGSNTLSPFVTLAARA